jgi:excinuclease ABC subunit C
MELENLINLDLIKEMEFKKFTGEEKINGGVYRMHDRTGEIVYVGKSSNMRKRIRSHKIGKTNTSYFIDEVEIIDCFIEPNPLLEMLLESILIAYYKPKYNDEVKDYKKKYGEDIEKNRNR